MPHGPAAPIEPAERAGVGARERAHEVVHDAARLAPIDAAVRRAATRQDGLVAGGLRPARTLAGAQARHETEQHVPVGRGDSLIQRRARVVGGDAERGLIDHRTAIHVRGEPDERVAGVAFPPEQRPVDGRAAAVVRQQRGVCPDHADAGQPQRWGVQDLAPADHEHDVGVESAQRLVALGIVDVADTVERDVVPGGERRVVDRAAASGRQLGPQRDDAGDGCSGIEQRLEREAPFRVATDPAEAHRVFLSPQRRCVRATSRTASITSVTSRSDSPGWSGRLSRRQ